MVKVNEFRITDDAQDIYLDIEIPVYRALKQVYTEDEEDEEDDDTSTASTTNDTITTNTSTSTSTSTSTTTDTTDTVDDVIQDDIFKHYIFEKVSFYVKDKSDNKVTLYEETAIAKYQKHMQLKINILDVKETALLALPDLTDFSNYLIYIDITFSMSNTNASCMPCGWDATKETFVTFYDLKLYARAMNYIKSLESNCEIPKEFIDFILNYEMLKSAIELSDYTNAELIYKRIFKTYKGTQLFNHKCNCHG